jgi:hypothetical protein
MTSPMPDYVPIPLASLGAALNDRAYNAGRVERNLYWVTDGDYHSAFHATWDGAVSFDAPRLPAATCSGPWTPPPRA